MPYQHSRLILHQRRRCNCDLIYRYLHYVKKKKKKKRPLTCTVAAFTHFFLRRNSSDFFLFFKIDFFCICIRDFLELLAISASCLCFVFLSGFILSSNFTFSLIRFMVWRFCCVGEFHIYRFSYRFLTVVLIILIWFNIICRFRNDIYRKDKLKVDRLRSLTFTGRSRTSGNKSDMKVNIQCKESLKGNKWQCLSSWKLERHNLFTIKTTKHNNR